MAMALSIDMPTCKLSVKTHHSCSFERSSNNKTDEQYQLLISLGHQLCQLSGNYLEYNI